MIARRRQYFRQPRLQPALGDARLYDDHSELNRPPGRQRAHAGFIAAHKSADTFPACPAIEQPFNKARKIAPDNRFYCLRADFVDIANTVAGGSPARTLTMV